VGQIGTLLGSQRGENGKREKKDNNPTGREEGYHPVEALVDGRRRQLDAPQKSFLKKGLNRIYDAPKTKMKGTSV